MYADQGQVAACSGGAGYLAVAGATSMPGWSSAAGLAGTLSMLVVEEPLRRVNRLIGTVVLASPGVVPGQIAMGAVELAALSRHWSVGGAALPPATGAAAETSIAKRGSTTHNTEWF